MIRDDCSSHLDFRATPQQLLSLREGLSAYGIATDPDEPFIIGVWLWTELGKLIVTPASVHFGGMLESCTLALSSPEAVLTRLQVNPAVKQAMHNPYLRLPPEELPATLPPPPIVQPWPFAQWSVTVLKHLDWVGTCAHIGIPCPAPGEVPLGTQSCLVAGGLLFNGSEGRRLLITTTDEPLSLVVSQDPIEIEGRLAHRILVPLEEYVRSFVPSHPM